MDTAQRGLHHAAPALYFSKGGCFDGVFTKLRAWGLIQYDKILLLDLGIISLQFAGRSLRARGASGYG